jgi:hypothetical protein
MTAPTIMKGAWPSQDPAASVHQARERQPGCRITASDLACLRTAKTAHVIDERVRSAAPMLGLCGGRQMLGGAVGDRHPVESPEESVAGLGLRPRRALLGRSKIVTSSGRPQRVVEGAIDASGTLGGARIRGLREGGAVLSGLPPCLRRGKGLTEPPRAGLAAPARQAERDWLEATARRRIDCDLRRRISRQTAERWHA